MIRLPSSTRRPALLFALAALATGVQAQSAQFLDHDGTLSSLQQMPGQRTGKIVGMIEAEGTPGILDFAWAFYQGEQVFTQPGGVTTHMYSRAEGQMPFLMDSADNPGVFEFSLPFGHSTACASFPLLPEGGYTLKLWVGEKGVFTQSGTNPPTGVLTHLQATVTVDDPEVAVWVDNPRTVPENTTTVAWVATATAVNHDRVFVVKGEGAAHPGVELAMVPANATNSAPFVVSFDDGIVEGVVTAIDDAGSVWSSSVLATTSASHAWNPTEISTEEGVWSNWSRCSRPAGPKPGFNGTARYCGPCQLTPVPDEATICTAIKQGSDGLYVTHKCSWAFNVNCYRRPASFLTIRVVVVKDDDYIECGSLGAGPNWRQRCCDIKQIGSGTVTVPSCFN